MKFGQLIQYNTRQNFVEKLYTKYGGETILRPYLKNQNLDHISGSIVYYKFIVCFSCMPSSGLSKDIETKPHTTCFYLIYSFFKKQKEVWN